MLGYNSRMTSLERKKHHETLKSKFNNKINAELEYAYMWVGNGDFLDALDNRAPNQIEYCKRSMEHPPLKLLDKMQRETTVKSITLTKKKCEADLLSKPSCYLCGKTLASSIVSIIDFSLLKCNCGQQYAHISCADNHITKSSQCSICKKYILLNHIRHSNLQQTLLRF
jgi:hypothetical protein